METRTDVTTFRIAANMIRRRWRTILWLLLMIVVCLNVAVFFSIPGSNGHADDSGDASSHLGRALSHLPVFRKRLNINNASSHLAGLFSSKREGAMETGRKHHLDSFIHGLFENSTEKDKEHVERDHEDADYYANERLVRNRIPENEISERTARNKDITDSRDLSSDGARKNHGFGTRANYSIPDVDNFLKTFHVKYEKTYYNSGNLSTSYTVFLNRLLTLRKKGVRLKAYIHNRGKAAWERFHYGIHQHSLYDPDDIYIDRLVRDMARVPIVDVEQKDGGTQIKLIITMKDDGQALCKPMRFPREQETLPDHYYFADYERHNAEIAAFHLDRVLGFHRVPPTTGRWMNVSNDIEQWANHKLAKTFFISPAGNLCFHGQCSYYCDSSHPICGHPIMLEGSLAAFLPPLSTAKRKTWRNPWKRSYSKHRKAYWEVYNDLCLKVKTKHPYNEGRRLLDLLDMSIFDFLTGNLDRHHYETFHEFGNNTFLLHLDNGRAFGKTKYDCISCLAPVRQCCMIRLSTLAKLMKLYQGPESLSHVMRQSLSSDPVDPILTEGHLDALDRRVSKILGIVNGCIKEGRSWDDVVIDDGVT